MKIGYYIRNYVLRDKHGKVAMVGGVKVISQHVRMLKQTGYEAILLTRNSDPDLNLSEFDIYEKPMVVKSDAEIPDCDIYVGTVPSDVKMLYRRGKGKIVHLCQGYEPVDYMARISGEAITGRYLRRGMFSRLRRGMDIWNFKKRIREIELIYALPTMKAAVSKHLAELIEKRYHQKCGLVQNGIDTRIFYPNENRVWGEKGEIRILSVGSMQVGFKGIPDALQSVRILKEKGISVKFTRVSPHPPSEREEVGKVVDHYYMNLREQEMAELYRGVDIFISSSLEGEGFGLPAMEALASGTPSILTEISSYRNFGTERDFAYFVPTHRPDRIADGVLALMEDRGLRERFRERGISVAKEFTLDRTKQALLNFVKEMS